MKTKAKRLTLYITLVLISVIYLTSSLEAQTPDLINYQSVVRDAQGQVIADQSISIRFSVLSGSSSGTEVFSEEHTLTTNEFGLINLMVGNGANQNGSLGTIDWSSGIYFLSTELDITAGSSYSPMGVSQLLSVPYALHAKTVEIDNVDDEDADPANEIQILSIVGDTLMLSSGGEVDLSHLNDAPELAALEQKHEMDSAYMHSLISANSSGIVLLDAELDSDSVALAQMINTHIVQDHDTSSTNEIQVLSFSGDTIYLNNGGAVYVGNYNDQLAINALATEVDQDSAAFSTALNNHLAADQDLSSTNEIQVISFSGDTLYLSDGGMVYLGGYFDNTDAQNLSSSIAGSSRTISISGGTSTTINISDADSSTTNEIQSLSLTGTTLGISSGNTVDLSVVQDGTGTDDQNLTLSGNTLSIESGNSVSLAAYLDNTDAQNLSSTSSGNNRTIHITGGVGTTINVADNDNSSTNEIQNLSLSGTTLAISSGNSVNLSALQDGTGTDDQNLTLSGTTLSIENGNSVNLSSLQDGTGTDNQTLSLSNDTLYIEDGNSVYLGSSGGAGDNDWDSTGSNIYRVSGNVGIGTSSPGAKLDVSGHVWQSGLGLSTFFGYRAGYNDDLTNNNNAFFGYNSGYSNTSGYFNSAFGYESMKNTTTGGENVAIGTQALYSNSTGSYNIAIGIQSLMNNTASGNVAIGRIAMSSNSTGASNTGVGMQVLYQNTTGNLNTALGNNVLRTNSNGSYNTSLGAYSMWYNTSGANNVAIGVSTLHDNTAGNENVAVGNYAGNQNTTGSGNVFLGNRSGFYETGSNKLYIENTNSSSPLIYGDFSSNLVRINGTLDINNAYSLPTSDGTSGQVLTTDGSGSVSWASAGGGGDTNWTVSGGTIYREVDEWVGIGVIPNAQFQIRGEIPGDGIDNDGDGWMDESGEDLIFNSDGRLGIGTTSPTEKLHVYGGSIKIDDGSSPYTLPASDGTSGQVLTTDGNGGVSWQAAGGGDPTVGLWTPDGLSGMIPVAYNFGSGSYTVPSGKNLYITNISNGHNACRVLVDGKMVQNAACNISGSSAGNSGEFQSPVIVGPGEVVSASTSGPPVSVVSFNGYLVSSTVTSVISSSYTVPSGYVLVITGLARDISSTWQRLRINGIEIYNGYGNENSNTTSNYYSLRNPAFAGPGDLVQVVSAGGPNGNFTGYIMPQ